MIMSLDGVSKSFGSFTALKDLSFDIDAGEILGVAGPNGAGKSTLMNVCTGALKATKGSVSFEGKDITRLSPDRSARLGIGKTFQIPTLVGSMTVAENVALAADFAGQGKELPSAAEFMELTGLASEAHSVAGSTDLLTRKRVMFTAALATGARIIFMDEPLGGLNHDEIDEFCTLIRKVNVERQTTIVMVEHKTRALADLSNRIMILNFGEMVCLAAPDTVMSDPEVIDIYLGGAHHA